MRSSKFCIHSISKIASACISLFETESEKKALLEEVENLQDYLEREPSVLSFLTDYSVDKKVKIDLLEIIRNTGFNEYFINTLMLLVDNGIISYLSLFLSTIRSKILKALEITNIFVYSCYEIHPDQKEKIERLWKERLGGKECLFEYALDKTLKLGVKVQIGNYVEEFSALSNLLNVKLKLEEIVLD